MLNTKGIKTAGRLSSLRLREQLVAAMLLAGLVPILVTAVIVGLRTGDALEAQVYNHLESVRATRASAIERYFGQVRDQVVTFSEDTMVVDAMHAFREAFHALPEERSLDSQARVRRYYDDAFGETYAQRTGAAADIAALLPRDPETWLAQELYIAGNPHPLGAKDELADAGDGSTYSAAHAKFHPILRNYLDRFGYYDIFLVDAETGHIVYSVFKELDFGTSLTTGPYADTSFARAFKAAAVAGRPDAAFLEDYAPYTPSYEDAASFIASPIYADGRLEGVLVFQMPVGRINAIMQQAEGLGETGETYLVGSDLMMRSQSRFTDEPTILSREVDSGPAARATAGEAGVETYRTADGAAVMSSFAPVNIDGVNWGILAEMQRSEALELIGHLRNIVAVVVGAAALLIALGAIWFARRLSRRVDVAVGIARNIAAGRFDNDVPEAGNDEVGELLGALDTMQSELFGKLEAERNSAMRIKAALDSAEANVMIADTSYNIVYMNAALQRMFAEREDTMRTVMPEFDAATLVGRNIDVFHKNPAHQRAMLERMEEVITTEITLADVILQLTVTPVLGENGERIGTMVEWLDVTAQKDAERQVEHLLSRAIAGELDTRLDTASFQGFMRELADSMNRMLDEIVKPLREVAAVMSKMSKGNLTARVEGAYEGEFGEMAASVNQCIGNLTSTLMGINASSESLSNAASAIAQGNNDLRGRTEEQAASLEETAASMEEMTATVQQNADNAREANTLAAEARTAAEDGGEVVRSAVRAMGQITESSSQIASIITTIDEIAFQTNLLALNAAVEAARAGEQGRGFAVVANEVRSLAQRSADAAREIKSLISGSVERVEEGSKLVDESGARLESIVVAVKKVSDIVSEISGASSEQASGIEQINQAVTEMDRMTQRNAAMTEEAASSSEAMQDEVKSLRSLVSFFEMN